MALKQNTSIYIPTFGRRIALLSLSRTAKLLGVRLNAIQNRIKRRTIEHHYVNNRPLIPDYTVSMLISKSRTIKVYSFECDSGMKIRFSSIETQADWMSKVPVGISGRWQIIKKKMPSWNGKSDEYFEYPEIHFYYARNLEGEAFGGDVCGWQAIMPKSTEDFTEISVLNHSILELLREGNVEKAVRTAKESRWWVPKTNKGIN